MQRLSIDVLQELQRQTQREDEAEGCGAGGTSTGGRGMAAKPPPETCEASFPFPEQSRSRTPPPPPTPASFVLESPVEGSSVPRRQTLRFPGGGGGGDEFDFFGSSSPSRQRPRRGSRTPPPPSRAPSLEAVPSQLLGGRAGSDADSLDCSPSPDSVRAYQFSQVASNVAAIRTLLSSSSVPGTPNNLLPVRVSSWKESLRESIKESIKEPRPSSPASERSSISTADLSTSSETSQASSLAYAVRNRRPDLRLLKKRNQPSQHLNKKASTLKPSDARRSPSFYTPRVVEDSGIIESTTAHISPTSHSTKPIVLKLPDLQRSTSAPIDTIQKAATFALPSIGKTLTASPEQHKQEDRDHFLSRSVSAQTLQSSTAASGLSARRPGLPPRQIRFESPKSSESPPEGVAKLILPPFQTSGQQTPGPHASRHHHHEYLHKQHYHAMTPPEREPSIGGLRSFHHGDSYFSTFPPDAMYTKEFVPARSPAPVEEPTKAIEKPPRPGPVPLVQQEPVATSSTTSPVKIHSDSTPTSPKTRRPSGLFKVFRKSTFNLLDQNGPPTENTASPASNPTTSPLTPATPAMFTVSSPEGAVNRRRFSSMMPDVPLPPYFARPRSRQTQSDGSRASSPGGSPLATIDDEPPTPPLTTDGQRRRGQNRSSSEQLSPMSAPRRPRMRTRHRHTLEEEGHDETERRSTPSPSMRAPVTSQNDGGVRSASSLDLKRHHHAPSTVSADSIRSVSPAHGTVNSSRLESEPEPPRKTNSGFKNFVLGVRRASFAVVDKLVKDDKDEDSPEARPDARRFSLPRNSLSIHRPRPPLRLRLSKSSASLLRVQRTRSTRMSRVKEESEEPTAEEIQTARRERLASIDFEVTNFQQTPFSQRYHDSRRAHQQHVRSLIEDCMDEDEEEDEDIQLGHEHNVPDHLPNSPLCPLHHKHKSGGKALCPLHGRYRKTGSVNPVKVGPARSRRMVDYHQPGPLVKTPRPPAPERHKSQAFLKRQVEIVFDTREEGNNNVARTQSTGQIKGTRTQSMGSIDGAWHSPAASRENVDAREPQEDRAIEVVDELVGHAGPKWNMEVCQMLDGRGRKRYKDACGSERRKRRVRMRRR